MSPTLTHHRVRGARLHSRVSMEIRAIVLSGRDCAVTGPCRSGAATDLYASWACRTWTHPARWSRCRPRLTEELYRPLCAGTHHSLTRASDVKDDYRILPLQGWACSAVIRNCGDARRRRQASVRVERHASYLHLCWTRRQQGWSRLTSATHRSGDRMSFRLHASGANRPRTPGTRPPSWLSSGAVDARWLGAPGCMCIRGVPTASGDDGARHSWSLAPPGADWA